MDVAQPPVANPQMNHRPIPALGIRYWWLVACVFAAFKGYLKVDFKAAGGQTLCPRIVSDTTGLNIRVVRTLHLVFANR
jgi:hypothetical protein